MDQEKRHQHENKENHYIDQDPFFNDDFDEETSAEMTDTDFDEQPNDEIDANLTSVYGWVAVALSVIAFFMVPILFAGAGIIVGFIARNKEAPILGNTAIAIGVIAIIARLFFVPLI